MISYLNEIIKINFNYNIERDKSVQQNVCSVRRFHDKELRKDTKKYGKDKNK